MVGHAGLNILHYQTRGTGAGIVRVPSIANLNALQKVLVAWAPSPGEWEVNQKMVEKMLVVKEKRVENNPRTKLAKEEGVRPNLDLISLQENKEVLVVVKVVEEEIDRSPSRRTRRTRTPNRPV